MKNREQLLPLANPTIASPPRHCSPKRSLLQKQQPKCRVPFPATLSFSISSNAESPRHPRTLATNATGASQQTKSSQHGQCQDSTHANAAPRRLQPNPNQAVKTGGNLTAEDPRHKHRYRIFTADGDPVHQKPARRSRIRQWSHRHKTDFEQFFARTTSPYFKCQFKTVPTIKRTPKW